MHTHIHIHRTRGEETHNTRHRVRGDKAYQSFNLKKNKDNEIHEEKNSFKGATSINTGKHYFATILKVLILN